MSKFAIVIIGMCIVGGMLFGWYQLQADDEAYSICCYAAQEVKLVATARDLPMGWVVERSDLEMLPISTCQFPNARKLIFPSIEQVIGMKVTDGMIKKGEFFMLRRPGSHQFATQRFVTFAPDHQHDQKR